MARSLANQTKGSVVQQNRFKLSSLGRFRPLIALFFVLNIATASAAAAVIDVTTYGTIPNDSADDSSAIQTAIDAAPANSTIYFPRGIYLLSGITINNRSGLTLSGDGSTLTILKRNGSYPKIIDRQNRVISPSLS